MTGKIRLWKNIALIPRLGEQGSESGRGDHSCGYASVGLVFGWRGSDQIQTGQRPQAGDALLGITRTAGGQELPAWLSQADQMTVFLKTVQKDQKTVGEDLGVTRIGSDYQNECPSSHLGRNAQNQRTLRVTLLSDGEVNDSDRAVKAYFKVVLDRASLLVERCGAN